MTKCNTVHILYGTPYGRCLLKVIQCLHLDRIAVWFLCSPVSRAIIPQYIRKHRIPMEQYQETVYHSFREFFLREKKEYSWDSTPEHLISPCDGWLSVYPIEAGRGFHVKGSYYQIMDLIQDPTVAARFQEGQCLIFRLCASDYHHYCFVDHGTVQKTQYIEGVLHSVQPIACKHFPVFSLNRRAWTLLDTEHFGPIVQIEIGALVVGGIVNLPVKSFHRGERKGRFELSGSTIMLLLPKNAICLRPEIQDALQAQHGGEIRVKLGMWIASRNPLKTGADDCCAFQ